MTEPALMHDQNLAAARKPKFKPPRGPTQSAQASMLQRFVYDASLALKEGCTKDGKIVMDVKTALAVQKLVGAWDTLRDASRVLRGKGLPASVRSKSGKQSGQVEPLNPA